MPSFGGGGGKTVGQSFRSHLPKGLTLGLAPYMHDRMDYSQAGGHGAGTYWSTRAPGTSPGLCTPFSPLASPRALCDPPSRKMTIFGLHSLESSNFQKYSNIRQSSHFSHEEDHRASLKWEKNQAGKRRTDLGPWTWWPSNKTCTSKRLQTRWLVLIFMTSILKQSCDNPFQSDLPCKQPQPPDKQSDGNWAGRFLGRRALAS